MPGWLTPGPLVRVLVPGRLVPGWPMGRLSEQRKVTVGPDAAADARGAAR